jgi:spore maturation protein CgeB
VDYLAPREFEFDVSFVGQINPTRAWIVDGLQRSGLHVECFGPGWPNGKVSFERMREIFHRSRINLNLSNSIPKDRDFARFARRWELHSRVSSFRFGSPKRVARQLLDLARATVSNPTKGPKNREQMKARYFEIAACGGFQIGKIVLGLEDYLEIGKQIAVYSDVSELAEQIRYYLRHDSERESMVRSALVRVKDYEYHRQLKKIFEDLA